MFRRKIATVAALIAVCAATNALAADDPLAKVLAAIAAPPKSGAVAAKPQWNVPNDGSSKDAPCSMSYRDGSNLMGYIGPFRGWNKSYFFVSGPKVPFATHPGRHRVALVSDGDNNQTVEAVRYPLDRKRGQFALLFELTDFNAALDAMDDSETVAVLEMRESSLNFRQSLFSGSWTGGHAARDKVRACLAAKK